MTPETLERLETLALICRAGGFCPECGQQSYVDENGCCVDCGATATGSAMRRLLDTLIPELIALVRENEALREAVEDAPHPPKCHVQTASGKWPEIPCDCWKASAALTGEEK